MEKKPTESAKQTHEPLHRTGKRLKKLLHPNGRRLHIADTPEEHMHLKRILPTTEPDEQFDVYIHGSSEHLDAVKEIHAHHAQKQNSFREKHGTVYEEFEEVKHGLDTMANELEQLTSHGVSLDANFSKFGYDAHIRTKEPDSSNNSVRSGVSSPHGDRDWGAEKQKGQALKFWKKPTVRQYFHKGLLWRASDTEEVAAFELFIDLLYVGIIGLLGDSAVEDPTGFSFLRFAITFILGWKMWSDLTLVISWFEADDVFQRIIVLFVMTCLFGFTLNIVEAFETTYTPLIAFYLAQRLFFVLFLLWIGYIIPMIQGHMILTAVVGAIPAILFVASVHVEYPNRLALIWIAIALDLSGMIIAVAVKRIIQSRLPEFAARHGRWFDFAPAMNIEHKSERTGAFTSLVFGYGVLSSLFQNRSETAVNSFFGKAVLGLIQAFCFNWLYFEIDAWNVNTHAIRRHMVSAVLWTSFHLPFIMGYVLAAAALSRLILATDCHDCHSEDLTEIYASRAEHEISPGLRWFYCGGLGVALLCMGVISISHEHKEFDGQRIAKKIRLVLRFAVSIIIICLGRAESLNSLELISTTLGLVALVLIVDVYGQTSVHDEFWRCTKHCKYRADCSVKKRALVDAVKNGTTIKLEELYEDEGKDEFRAIHV